MLYFQTTDCLCPGLSTNAQAAAVCLFVWVGDAGGLFRRHQDHRLPSDRLPARVHLWPVGPLWWSPGELPGLRVNENVVGFVFISNCNIPLCLQVPGSSYSINVCGSVAEPACKQSAVCQVSGSGSAKVASSFGISKAMTMDFKHEEQAVLMQYGGGDVCPPG